MSDDAIGPARRSVYVEFDQGDPRIYETRRDVGRFVEQLGDEQPELARRVLAEFDTRRLEANCEALIYNRGY